VGRLHRHLKAVWHVAGNAQDLGSKDPDRHRLSARHHVGRACPTQATPARGEGLASRQRHFERRVDFLRDRARRSNQEVVRYIDARKDRWGVEPICRALQFAPSTYYATLSRPPSPRQVRDQALTPEIVRVHQSNNDGTYGAKKVWKQLNREGITIANCTVRRLMKDEGLSGVRRGRQFRVTTVADEIQHRPSDLVDRQFVAAAPNRLWVADLTYVKTHSGWVYVAFIIDVFSRAIVGWQCSTSLRSDLAIDALEMAIYSRNGRDLSALIHHSDRGVQYLSIRYTERLGDAEIVASVGSKGDSYDNALAESFNGLYKNELIHRKGPWRNVEHVEWATLNYVDWFNNRRIHESLDYVAPVEFEAHYYDTNESDNLPVLEMI
jgi:putative transposase